MDQELLKPKNNSKTITAIYEDRQLTKLRKNSREAKSPAAVRFALDALVLQAPSLASRPALRLHHVVDRPFVPWELLILWGAPTR